jgi:hypothetical protein
MERTHPAPAQTLLQGKARIFPKISVEEISRSIRQFAPDYCGDCVNDKPQALFDDIRRFMSIAVLRVGPCLAHGALHQARPSNHQGILLLLVAARPRFQSEATTYGACVSQAPMVLQSRENGSLSRAAGPDW